MTKKEFADLLTSHMDKFVCLVINDSTLRYGYPQCNISIVWKNTTHKSTVKELRGKVNDVKNLVALDKYKRWASEIVGLDGNVS